MRLLALCVYLDWWYYFWFVFEKLHLSVRHRHLLSILFLAPTKPSFCEQHPWSCKELVGVNWTDVNKRGAAYKTTNGSVVDSCVQTILSLVLRTIRSQQVWWSDAKAQKNGLAVWVACRIHLFVKPGILQLKNIHQLQRKIHAFMKSF